MRYALLPTAFALGVSAAAIRRADDTPCCFALNVEGRIGGAVVQTSTGLNQVNGTESATKPQGSFCISDQTITDGEGRPCYISSTNQFECNGAGPAPTGFTIADNNDLLWDGCPDFSVCPSMAGDGSYNIFKAAANTTVGCQSATLLTGGYSCAALGSSSTPSVAATTLSSTSLPQSTNSDSAPTVSAFLSTTTSAAASVTTSAAATCPTALSNSTAAQSPNLIVPISSNVTTAYQSSTLASINPTNSTLFNFDIPSTLSGQTCALLFLFPFSSDLADDATYQYSGIEEEVGEDGGLDFALLDSAVVSGVTFATAPAVKQDFGKTQVLPGNGYVISQFDCVPGTLSYKVSSVGAVTLNFYQDSNPSAVGLYVVPC